MSSWRDSTSQQAQDDLDELLNGSLPFAKEQLARYGEFYPYGVLLGNDGNLRHIAAYTGDDHPPSTELLDMLVRGARKDAETIRAAAFVADVRIAEGQDAIRVELEHKEGPALAVLLPYTKGANEIEYGDLMGVAGKRQVWV